MIRGWFLALTLVVAVACGRSGTPTDTATDVDAVLAVVKDPSLVCMVNDRYMGVAQIPVEVQGRTYFGCCEMCKGRLANEPAVRTAVDPVSGEAVDKARAVIGQDAAGVVYYFASERNLRRYRPPGSPSLPRT